MPVSPSNDTNPEFSSLEKASVAYERVSSEDRENPDADGLSRTLSTSRSSSTVALVRHVRRVGSWTVPGLMLGTFLGAIIVAVSHHIFLLTLDGKSVNNYALPQTWVRDLGNALAHIVQILLETSVGVALTQSIWFYVRRSTVKLPELDDLFSLPSVLSVPYLVLRIGTIYVLLVVISIQAFSLVTILAPSALSVTPAGPALSMLSIPVPTLSMIPLNQSVVPSFFGDGDCHPDRPKGVQECDDNELLYSSASTAFKRVAQNVLSNGLILPWTPPAGCGLKCNYTVAYQGPSLQCTDIPASSIAPLQLDDGDDPLPAPPNPKGYLQSGTVYNTTTSLGRIWWGGMQNGVQWPPSFASTTSRSPYMLNVVYAMDALTSDYQQFSETAGASCVFTNASYTASVSFLGGSQTVTTRIKEYGEPYPSLTRANISVATFSVTDPDVRSAYATLGIMDAIARSLTGTVVYTTDKSLMSSAPGVLDSALFSVRTETSGSISLIASTQAITYFSLGLGQTSLSRALEDLCANITASLMSDMANLGIYASAPSTVLPDGTIYNYQLSRLWLVYGLAIFVALVADAFGLACMRSNGGAMQCTFSTIAASTRGSELSELLSGPDEPLRAAAKIAKLQYRGGTASQGERSGFTIIEGEGVRDEEGLAETATLNNLRDERS